jgi:hypothetical protein
MSVYIVDTNFFIQAHRANYPLDIAVTFWERVKVLAVSGQIISIDKVKHEIYSLQIGIRKIRFNNLEIIG